MPCHLCVSSVSDGSSAASAEDAEAAHTFLRSLCRPSRATAAGWRLAYMRFRKYTVALVSMMLAVAAAINIAPLRTPLLRAMGRFLVATDQLQHADVIVLSVDSDGAGVLEATDLVHEHVADHVALFADPPDAVDREFLRRGVSRHNAAAVSVRQLHELGIDAVEVIPRTVAGTDDESRDLAAWCSEHRYSSVLFVSTIDHSRRTARILAREGCAVAASS
jgi:hypothetical protein